MMPRFSPIQTVVLAFALLIGCKSSDKNPTQPVETPHPITAVERYGALRVEGNQIVGRTGQPVVLRGMSLFWSQWMGQFYNEGAIRTMRDSWHADIIRVAMGVGSGGYLSQPEVERRKAEAAIDAAIKLGMYVIIDWHAHDPEPAAASAFFASIAKKYGAQPNLIYETWNEPLPIYAWHTVIKPYHVQVIDSIRAHDPDNLIVCGTRSWSQDVDEAAADPLTGPNLAYTLHFYAGTHRQELRDKATAALAKGAALMVTEWGTSEATGDGRLDSTEARRWLAFTEANHLSWCNWSVADKAETSASLRPGASPTGGWSDGALTPSGLFVRRELRLRNPDPAATQP